MERQVLHEILFSNAIRRKNHHKDRRRITIDAAIEHRTVALAIIVAEPQFSHASELAEERSI